MPLALLLFVGCSTRSVTLGDFTLVFHRNDGTIDASHAYYPGTLDGLALDGGTASADVTMQFGAFRWDAVETRTVAPTAFRDIPADEPILVRVEDADGDLGILGVTAVDGVLVLDWSPGLANSGRVGFTADCGSDPHFLGLGGHAFDVDHAGEAFSLWVSEPGIGKVDTDVPPDDWYVRGTRHATSFPVPFLLRPEQSAGLLLDTTARVDLDLCASDPDRFSAAAWTGGPLRVAWLVDDAPMDPVATLARSTGAPDLPPPWVFMPWNDAIRGSDRVREVAATLRAAGAPSSVIWTEDWKGAEQTSVGYHLTGEWFLDTALYPDAVTLAADLEADGFAWLAYFSPFVTEDTATWDSAVSADALIRNGNGNEYTFTGVTFEATSIVDLSGAEGREWATAYMQDAIDVGFDGWMADYAEWLPTDAVLADGDPWLAHNAYPLAWQETNADALAGHDGTFFVRSGWIGTSGLAPVVWGGDQRTSFDTDDGMPTVVALGLGLSTSGVPVFTHDVAGYQSIGNPPSDKELWFRWASLGAYSPILRTHHGAFDSDNWQFDSDAETLAHWTSVAREHVRLFPYRYGLAARAVDDGVPMLRPVAFEVGGAAWDRTDAWMLGHALLVAPVLEAGATGRDVDLPDAVRWFDWATRAPAASGFHDAPVGAIPVFVREGTVIPTFDPARLPDTARGGDPATLTTLDEADVARVVYVFGAGGTFEEADGTTYAVLGTPTTAAEATVLTLDSGEVEVGGVTVAIDGPMSRSYTVVVTP
jgi:alpha-glucosidase (family GH31 glycosyl hydrolase)